MRIVLATIVVSASACSLEVPPTPEEVWGIYDVHRDLAYQVASPHLDWPTDYAIAISHDRISVIANTTTTSGWVAIERGVAQFHGSEEWTSVAGSVMPELAYELDASDASHLVGTATSNVHLDGVTYDFVFDVEATKRRPLLRAQ